jgi:hypothetical protein
MASLPDILNSESQKSAVIEDALSLLDSEVQKKGGVSGMAIKTGYKTVKGVKPGFLRGAVEDLLPDFAQALDPMYQEALQQGASVSGHIAKDPNRVADALLAITDAKAARAKTKVVKGAYDRLRGQAKKHVEAAVPGLAELVAKHAPGSA